MEVGVGNGGLAQIVESRIEVGADVEGERRGRSEVGAIVETRFHRHLFDKVAVFFFGNHLGAERCLVEAFMGNEHG